MPTNIAERRPNQLGSVTVAEAMEAAGRSSRQVIIDPLVASEETSLLQSQPRDGKTWFVLGGGLAVARGLEFAGFRTTQTNVLYVTNEDGVASLTKRLRMLMTGFQISGPPDNF